MLKPVLRYNTPVLMTLMCQHVINTGEWVDTRLVQRWLQMSKPTALDVMSELLERGYIERRRTRYRSNAVKYYYRPKRSIFEKYRKGDYREAYKAYMNW